VFWCSFAEQLALWAQRAHPFWGRENLEDERPTGSKQTYFQRTPKGFTSPGDGCRAADAGRRPIGGRRITGPRGCA